VLDILPMKLMAALTIYWDYLIQALIEIYFYYSSPYPLLVLMKRFALANRKIRITLFPKNIGRPLIDQKTIELIFRLKKLNPTWGAPKICDELKKIGIFHSRSTIAKYLEIYQLTPAPNKNLSWNEFLGKHKFKIAIDFTCVISFFGKQLFVLVILEYDLRKLIFINVTSNPTADWVTQQFRNAFLDVDKYPTLCICDNDVLFGKWFENMMFSYFETKIKRIPFRRPDKNGRVERFHRSLKEEGIQNVVPIFESQLRRVCLDYQNYYNHFRPHQGISGQIPQKGESKPKLVDHYYEQIHLHGGITSLEPCFSAAG